MSIIPILSGNDIVRILEKVGYRQVRQRGSHIRLMHGTMRPVTVPNYRNVSKGLLRKILRDAELSVEDFIDLL